VDEFGRVNGTFDNVVVAYAGQWVNVNATAVGATQGFYLPFRDQGVVNVQVVPGSTSHALFEAPSTPGVYGAPESEYDGPWFGQDAAVLVVLPAPGVFPSLAQFQSNGGEGDIYNPPVHAAATADLVGAPTGLFNSSVPGPTLAASPGAVSFQWEIPLSSIGVNNYLVNVTSTNPQQQQQFVIDHDYVLPDLFGIWSIQPLVGLVPVTDSSLVINSLETETATLAAGAYLYGVIQPVDYSYDPSGDSGVTTGSDTGFVMGLWGVLWVA
jgi:terminal oxidase subunit